MKAPGSLRDALGIVGDEALLPLMDHCAADRAARTPEYRATEEVVAKALANRGAFVIFAGAQPRVAFAGIDISSKADLLETLLSWRQIARKKIERSAS